MRKAPVVISSDRRIAQLESSKLAEHLYIVNAVPGPTAQNVQVVGLQGFGALSDRPVSNAFDLECFLQNIPKHKLVDEWSQNVRGAVSLYLFEPLNNAVRLLPDPLGASVVFYYEKDGIRAASANLHDLISVLNSTGIFPKKSLKFAIELAISTNGGLNDSSYEDVKSLDIFHYAVIGQDKLEIIGYRGVDYSASTARSYREMIDAASTEILNTVTAATRLSSTAKICHLTGGFDSRLVAAATLNAGVSESYRFFCQGDSVLPDKVMAEMLAADLGLTMTNYSGISTRYSPSDFGGGLVAPMIASAGLLPVGPHFGSSFNDTLILSGGYGGTFRSTYDYRFLDRGNEPVSGNRMGRALWGEYLFAGGEGSLLSRDYSDFLASEIEHKMEQGRAHGVREDALGDFFYLQTRARYFISHISSAWNRYIRRIDPLYSPVAIHGALTLPLGLRAANGIGYDLALKLDKRILEYPFDTEKFDLGSLNRVPEAEIKQFSGNKAVYDNKLNDAIEKRDFGFLRIPKATSEDVALAKKMNARAYQVSGRAVARESLNELLASIPSSDLRELLNLKEIDILRKRPANTRVRMRTLFNLYSSLEWYLNSSNVSLD